VFKAYLFGIGTIDRTTFAGVSALLILVAFAAWVIPAFRAMRVNPMEALRYD
jgi:ABC-type antimicrobial peptide transport system permease subunit